MLVSLSLFCRDRLLLLWLLRSSCPCFVSVALRSALHQAGRRGLSPMQIPYFSYVFSFYVESFRRSHFYCSSCRRDAASRRRVLPQLVIVFLLLPLALVVVLAVVSLVFILGCGDHARYKADIVPMF